MAIYPAPRGPARLPRYRSRERGLTTVEYVVVLVLIAAVSVFKVNATAGTASPELREVVKPKAPAVQSQATTQQRSLPASEIQFPRSVDSEWEEF